MIASSTVATRKPFGAISGKDNIAPQPRMQLPRPAGDGVKDKDRRRSRALADLSGNKNIEKDRKGKVKDKVGGKDHVKERVREWEREKERLREMARLEDIEKEGDELIEERGRQMVEWKEQMEAARVTEEQQEKEEERESDKENHHAVVSPPVTSPTASTFMTGIFCCSS